ncbi:hypothetical protein F4825DRAFT_418645 [Nemania diffusa]|nr:hypothetical protein F4825DRAFT_418645 [Nemania diffusa]
MVPSLPYELGLSSIMLKQPKRAVLVRKTGCSAHVRTRNILTFGVPEPVETGFAYAQFKCQYYCQNHSDGGSFFVHADSKVGSYCDCFNELMDPETFVTDNQSLVGAWNAICRTETHI